MPNQHPHSEEGEYRMAKEYDWGQDFPIKYRLKAKKSKSKKASKKENKENNRPGITDY